MNRIAKSSLVLVAAVFLAATVSAFETAKSDAENVAPFAADIIGPAEGDFTSKGFAAVKVPSINDMSSDQLCRSGTASLYVPFDTGC